MAEVTSLPARAGCALWLVLLDQPLSAQDLALLSPQERERASRFAFMRERIRFIAAHSALRQILGRSLNRRAADLHFVFGPKGKPALAEFPGCRFNLSHSGAMALIAINPQNHGAQVGVDLEILRVVPDAQEMARAHFHAQDQRFLTALSECRASRPFLIGWTRKEACFKAMGHGLSDTPLPPLGMALDTHSILVPGTGGNAMCNVLRLSSFELPQADAVASLALFDSVSALRPAAPVRQDRLDPHLTAHPI